MRPLCRHCLILIAGWTLCVPRGDAVGQGTTVPRVRDSNVGYIDPAIPGNVLRFRFDAAYDNLRPTRADFFWAVGGTAGPGPAIPESSVDYQDLSVYGEALLTPSFSAFVNLPARFLDPEQNPNTAGMADMDLGFKRTLIDEADLVATFQFRTYLPTGDVDRGLGNNHVSLEPALLVYKPLGEYWGLEAELRDWIPIDGTDLAGNVIRYGVGVHCTALSTCCWQLTPVAEFVGWTVLDGGVSVRQPSGAAILEDAAGDTIVNAKLGVRMKYGEQLDFYTGYGRPLTGDSWYEDIYRFELRYFY
jgi:hypothetical protein